MEKIKLRYVEERGKAPAKSIMPVSKMMSPQF